MRHLFRYIKANTAVGARVSPTILAGASVETFAGWIEGAQPIPIAVEKERYVVRQHKLTRRELKAKVMARVSQQVWVKNNCVESEKSA